MTTEKGTLSQGFVYPYSGRTPLQVVRWTGSRISFTLSGTSARLALPSGSKLIEITATENCYIAFGDNTVVASSTIDATSRLFMAGVQVVPVPVDSNGVEFTHIAAIQAATGGTLQIERVS